jgi:hypothetical protein
MQIMTNMKTETTLIIAHGDLDGVISAALLAAKFGLESGTFELVFAQPFLLDKVQIPATVDNIYVVDIALNNRAPEMTLGFIKKHSAHLVKWYDHHQGWPAELAEQSGKFVINSKARSCAEVVGGDAAFIGDAVAADTRSGKLSARGELLERALKADMKDDAIKRAAVAMLMGDESGKEEIFCAAEKYSALETAADKIAAGYRIIGKARGSGRRFRPCLRFD